MFAELEERLRGYRKWKALIWTFLLASALTAYS
jgi:hypothetical protein